MYDKQVNKDHYNFERYFFPARWMSYYYQTREICSRQDIKSVLDIGPGTAFLKGVLQIHRPDITYKTLDIADDVNPDYIGGVTQIPLQDNSYDVVCAFQVLEHIEFDDVEQAVQEMSRVSKRYVFVSVPHFGPSIEWQCKLPFLPRLRFAFKIPFHKQHVFNGQHYWEIGKKNFPAARIKKILTKHLELQTEFIPFENQYHHFYILKKNE